MPDSFIKERNIMQQWIKMFDKSVLEAAERIYKENRVEISSRTQDMMKAKVHGQKMYDVVVALKNDNPVRLRCNCPKSKLGRNCEHMAAAMYFLYADTINAEKEKKKQEEEATLMRLRKAEIERIEREQRAKEEERERLEKAEREEQERQQCAKEEKAKQIAEKKALKAAQKADRKKKREEAQKAEQLKRETEAKKKIEEEQKRQEEQEKREQEAEARKKAEEEARKIRQAEEERKKQKKIQDAIMKKKNIENREYSYFDIDKMMDTLDIEEADREKGQKLCDKGDMELQTIDTGYIEGENELMLILEADCRVGSRGHVRVNMLCSKLTAEKVTCSCDDCRRYGYYYWHGESNCKYVAATLLKAREIIEKRNMGDATDKTGAVLLNLYRMQRGKGILANAVKNEESIRLEPRIVQHGKNLELSFKIGTTKMYVVKDLEEFATAVESCATLIYGKDTEINHQPDNFTQESRKWITYINRAMDEERIIHKRISEHRYYYGRNDLKCSEIKLYGWRLDRFYQLLGEDGCEYEDRSGNTKKKAILHTKEKNPHIIMNIDVNKDRAFEGIKVNSKLPDFFEGEKAAYYIEDGYLKKVDEEFTEKAKLLFTGTSNGELYFQVGRKKLQDFYYNMLPQLADIVEIKEKHREEIEKYLPPEVRFLFYLDSNQGNIECKVNAVYGENEISILDTIDANEEADYSFRMRSREEEILFLLQEFFPYYDKGRNMIHCGSEEELIFQVLKRGLDVLAGLGEVHCTQAFKNMNVIQKVKVSVGVAIQNGMLDLDIISEELSQKELLEILDGYRAKKTYFRLKNGSFVNLENDELKMLEEITNTLQLSPKEFIKGKVHLPIYRSLYLDKLLEENSSVYNTRDKSFRSLIKNFKAVNEADFEEPECLAHIMRGYQRNGFKWMKLLESYGFGGILADDMGLGKTLQTIAVLLAAKQENVTTKPSLVVAPASLVFNWKDEFERYAPQLAVGIISGSQEERQEVIASYEDYDVLVTSYDLLKRDISYYEEKEFDYQIIDEAQYIKNHTTAAAKSVKVIKSRVKYALTGTPIENRLSELWSIFDYLMPGFLYRYDTFKKEIETKIVKNEDEEAAKRLQRMVAPFILRRLKTDVLKDLPDKLEETRVVAIEGEQRKLYDAQVVHMRQEIAKQSGEEFSRNKLQILAELTKLRQICCDPSLCFENYHGESAKTEACIELVQSALEGGHKVLLFSQFTTMLEILEKRLKTEGITYYKITGETPKEKRLQLVKEFNENNVGVFLISLKAGGVGLNLTGADVVIHYDPWWNVAAQNQATDRAHRIGQQKKVTVYKLIVKQSVEEKIQKLQEAKKDLADKVINGETNQLSNMSQEELLEILSC